MIETGIIGREAGEKFADRKFRRCRGRFLFHAPLIALCSTCVKGINGNNFDEVKKQLSELSEVVNKFKSEAVQLRIVEIVLGNGSYSQHNDETQNDAPGKIPKSRRRKTARNTHKTKTDTAEGSGEKTAKKSRPSGQGAPSTLNDLVEGNFFDKPKTISDIVAHCEQKLARRFKSNEFSGKLGRLTREGILDRNKNGDGQYEYVKA